MKILCIIFIVFLIILCASYFKSKDRLEFTNIHRLFEPMAIFIGRHIEKMPKIYPSIEKCRAININRKLYVKKSIVYTLEIIFIFIVFSMISIGKDVYIDDNKIKRPGENEKSKNYELYYDAGNEEGKIDFLVKKKKRTLEEIKDNKEEIRKIIYKRLLADNEDSNNIVDRLNFFSRIDEYDLLIRWEYDTKHFEYDYTPKRSVENDIKTKVTAHIKAEDDYEYEEEFDLIILKAKLLKNNISSYIKEKEDYIDLPDKIDDKKIKWKLRKGDNGINNLIMILILGILIFYVQIRNIGSKYSIRESKLIKEYPYLVGILILYMETGLSISNAWLRLCETYDEKSIIKRELKTSKGMIENGKSLDVVFSDFSRNCNTKEYRKLSQLITQNLKSGSSTILNILRQEMDIIKKDRLNFVKVIAKKTETRLLVPLIIMLLLVFFIILTPSFISFRI